MKSSQFSFSFLTITHPNGAPFVFVSSGLSSFHSQRNITENEYFFFLA